MNFKFEKASEDVPSAANKKQRCLILENDPAGRRSQVQCEGWRSSAQSRSERADSSMISSCSLELLTAQKILPAGGLTNLQRKLRTLLQEMCVHHVRHLCARTVCTHRCVHAQSTWLHTCFVYVDSVRATNWPWNASSRQPRTFKASQMQTAAHSRHSTTPNCCHIAAFNPRQPHWGGNKDAGWIGTLTLIPGAPLPASVCTTDKVQ